VAVLNALGLDRAAYWGASMGGTIGLQLLASHPQRLTALIAGGAHGEGIHVDPAELEQEAEMFRAEGAASFLPWLEQQGPVPSWLRDTLLAADSHALAALSTGLANRDDMLDALASTSVPVLLLAGDQDRQLPAIQRTAELMPSATLTVLPDCSHLESFTRGDRTLPVVLPFLAGSA
jgi:pimeloyl-ACP methyl ester carboxylesterase